ncbi:MAG TPA: ShlB/FhaC/HecB family hemolysin secretion/activation protein [Paucimonas sp.]|nr:ShlB/FhaC/HecB family hemolysin secretion/activation protein [Paucimonas sp.]
MKRHLSRILMSAALAVSFPLVHAADETDNPIGRFDIVRFQVDGNTLLSGQEIESLLAPYAGKNRDFGDVQRALEALEAAYRAHGYNVVQVLLPEQELNQGVVHLAVVETRIGKVTVQGNRVFDTANIRRSLPGLREGEIPNIGRISTSLRMANENPAKKTSLQLQSGDKDDEINALLKVEDGKEWRIGANLANTGSGNTGKSHVGLTYQHANVAGLDHVMSLQYTTTLEKPSQVSVWGAGYHVPLYALGDSIDLFGSYSNVDSGSITAGIFNLQVSGKGAVYGLRYNKGLGRTGDFESKLIFGADYKAYKNDVQLQGLQIGNNVTVHPLSIAWLGVWTLAAGEASVNLAAMANVPGGSNGGADDFNLARVGASSRYKLVRIGASLTRALPQDWQMRMTFNSQYTDDALIPGEQFGAGGASSVRGFAEREVSNDTGYGGSAEVYTPNLCTAIRRVPAQCRMLAFVDAAHASRNKPLPSETTQVTIASAGIGFRMTLDKYLAMQFDYGRVVKGGGVRETGSSRAHFSLNMSY